MIRPIMTAIINAKARLWAGSAWLTISLYRFFSEIPVRLDVAGIWRFLRFYGIASPNSNWSISRCRKTVPGSDGIGTLPRTYASEGGSERPEAAYPAWDSREPSIPAPQGGYPVFRIRQRVGPDIDHSRVKQIRPQIACLGRQVGGSGVLP
jgi:hypothetical protein